MSQHLTPVRMAIIKNVGEDVEKKEHYIPNVGGN
jgi:hypothetical protein